MFDYLSGILLIAVYFLIFAAAALLLRRPLKMHNEVFRKTLHMMLLGSIFPWIYFFEHWITSVLSVISFAFIVYLVMLLCEYLPNFSELLMERKKGEIRKSVLSVFAMIAIMITICWGLFGVRYYAIASVLAWGIGDAAAAVVGKTYGKHYLTGKLIEGRKTVEGCIAMCVASFLSVTIVLLAYCAAPWYIVIPVAMLTAIVCTIVELFTKNGMDTVTCPFAAAAVMIPLIHFGIAG